MMLWITCTQYKTKGVNEMKQKKIGNANRTKNQIRSSKSKGSSMEYDCHESLLAK